MSWKPLPLSTSVSEIAVAVDRLGYKGVIFSDDLNMEGARVAGDILGRAKAAYAAGCDMLLVCNRPDLAAELLDRWAPEPDPDNLARLAAIVPSAPQPAWLADHFALELHAAYVQARERVVAIADDSNTAPTMTAATIGAQRTEILRNG